MVGLNRRHYSNLIKLRIHLINQVVYKVCKLKEMREFGKKNLKNFRKKIGLY